MLGECLVFRLKPNQGYLHPGWLGTRLHAKRAENPPGQAFVLRLGLREGFGELSGYCPGLRAGD